MEALQQQVIQISQQFIQQQQQFNELQQQLTAAIARAQQAETERTQALQLAAAAQLALALAQQAINQLTTTPLTNQPLLDTKALGQAPKTQTTGSVTKLVRMETQSFGVC